MNSAVSTDCSLSYPNLTSPPTSLSRKNLGSICISTISSITPNQPQTSRLTSALISLPSERSYTNSDSPRNDKKESNRLINGQNLRFIKFYMAHPLSAFSFTKSPHSLLPSPLTQTQIPITFLQVPTLSRPPRCLTTNIYIHQEKPQLENL